MKSKWLSVLTAGLLLLLSISQASAVSVSQTSSPDLDTVQTYLEVQMRRQGLKGMAVAITQGDEIIYLQGFGSAGGSQPVTPQTPFFIGSVSKSFTALAVMQLVDQGLVDLDEPVQTYIPWFTIADSASASKITIRHLLNQTSGLANASLRRPNITEETTLEETVRHLSQAQLIADPGTTFQYFNPNYNILAQVVEEVTGTAFEMYLTENVIQPLNLIHTFVDLESAQAAGVADGHIFFLGFPLSRQQRFFPAELPAGFVISSAEDMAHYMIAQNNGGIFQGTQITSSEAVSLMHTPPPGIDSDYAMGWIAQEKNGVMTIRHNGAVETFFTDVILLPDQDIGITILINQNALIPLIFIYGSLTDGLVDAVLGNQPTTGLSMRFIYAILIALIIYDITRHIISLRQVSKWWARVHNKSNFWRVIGVVLQHLLIPVILIFIINMMITTAGINAARITLLYYMFDIALWLTISAILSIIEAVQKFRWMASHQTVDQPTG